jgi:YD repeat-containing protein
VTGGTCNTDGHDSFDNLLKRTDARGVLTSYAYDTINRLREAENIGVGFTVPAVEVAPSAPRNCEEVELELVGQEQ